MLAALLVTTLLSSGPTTQAEAPPPPPHEVQLGLLSGQVRDERGGQPVADASVLLHCDCLDGARETQTNEEGRYRFSELPAGEYTIQVVTTSSEVSRSVSLPGGTKAQTNFSLEHATPSPPHCEGPNCERPWTGPEPRYWGGSSYGEDTNLRNGGLGLIVAGGGLAVGSLLAGTVNMCGRDGAQDTSCAQDTRIHLAIGFGVAAAALTSAGATVLGIAKKRRQTTLSLSGDQHGANISLSGRF